jgi:hypothetical protein
MDFGAEFDICVHFEVATRNVMYMCFVSSVKEKVKPLLQRFRTPVQHQKIALNKIPLVWNSTFLECSSALSSTSGWDRPVERWLKFAQL